MVCTFSRFHFQDSVSVGIYIFRSQALNRKKKPIILSVVFVQQILQPHAYKILEVKHRKLLDIISHQ